MAKLTWNVNMTKITQLFAGTDVEDFTIEVEMESLSLETQLIFKI